MKALSESRLVIASPDDMSSFASTIMNKRYAHDLPGGKETWPEVAYRVASNVLGAIRVPQAVVQEVANLIASRKFMPGGRYLAASGRPFHQVQNCVLLRPEDSREGWADHASKSMMSLMTGAGIGGVYSDLRRKGAPIKRTGGESSGPCALAQGVNELGRVSKQGGSRRAAIWGGLHWNHPDIFEWINQKDWPEEIRAMKAKDFNFPAPMDHTNISVILDTEFFAAYDNPEHPKHSLAVKVYWDSIAQMVRWGEPGFSVDCGVNEGENLRNACTEITSRDDSDICNLGSINMARIDSLSEMKRVVELGSLFLLAGTVYSDIPYKQIGIIREKNRRLGLGLMGLHEWLLVRNRPYAPDSELAQYLTIYRQSGAWASEWANKFDLSCPIKTRAVAPTGTIGIVAETTTGIEPIFCAAYKRRFFDHGTWKYQFVVDPTAARLVRLGIDPEKIDDAYTITPEKRLAFQGWVQGYVDHAISSTLNMAAWGTEENNQSTTREFGETMMKHLPNIRGVTVYPDGSRGGQPLNRMPYSEVVDQVGETFVEESLDVCDITKGGSCGA